MTTLADHRAQFTAEFTAQADQLAHACAELGRLMATYRINPASLIDAQDHALASLTALRNVAEALPGTGRPVSPTRPAQWPGTLADQITSHRVAIVQTLALLAHMPGVAADQVTSLTSHIADLLARAERAAVTHQPGKART